MAALKAIRVFIVRNYSVTEEVKTISNYIVNAEICGLFSYRYTVAIIRGFLRIITESYYHSRRKIYDSLFE